MTSVQTFGKDPLYCHIYKDNVSEKRGWGNEDGTFFPESKGCSMRGKPWK